MPGAAGRAIVGCVAAGQVLVVRRTCAGRLCSPTGQSVAGVTAGQAVARQAIVDPPPGAGLTAPPPCAPSAARPTSPSSSPTRAGFCECHLSGSGDRNSLVLHWHGKLRCLRSAPRRVNQEGRMDSAPHA
ncbi:hypothetical protein EAO68_33980 [Streptomyces sp. wa22]|nr:hypothetical protein EAO68_33980 [Streptomyces sp. wa22]